MGNDGNWIKEVTYLDGHKEIIRYLGTGFDVGKGERRMKRWTRLFKWILMLKK